MARFRIAVSSQSTEAMIDLVRKHKVQVLDHGARRNDEGRSLVYAIATEEDIARLENAGYTVEKYEDVDETGKARQLEVGKGDRYRQKPSS
ncbi:MAG: hypothetical protein ACXVZX_04420 [Terriglobales bacterium]